MKIVFLSYYNGLVNRGVETFVHELANRLSRHNDIRVFQGGAKLPGTKYFVETIESETVKDFSIQALERIKDTKIILFPTNGRWQSLLCKLWSVRNKSKMVISGQSGPGLDDRINLFIMPDIFIALTSYQRQWASRANPFAKIETVPNGVDLEKFRPGRSTVKIDLPKPIILYVAALHKDKRQDLAINAVSRLRHGSLLLVGDGPDKEFLSKKGQELLPGRFKIISFPHEKMPQVYRSADLFTYPTVPWESFGIAAVEAMASGIPVVAPDDPIRKEIIGKAGLFVNPENSDEYARSLELALNQNWGNSPRIQASSFSWDEIAVKYDLIFKKLNGQEFS
jgi:glycosyltransferase involved in cell wall biosynthesis